MLYDRYEARSPYRRVDLNAEKYTPEVRTQFARELSEKLQVLPGVRSATIWGPSMPGRATWVVNAVPEGRQPDDPKSIVMSSRHSMNPGALAARQQALPPAAGATSAAGPGTFTAAAPNAGVGTGAPMSPAAAQQATMAPRAARGGPGAGVLPGAGMGTGMGFAKGGAAKGRTFNSAAAAAENLPTHPGSKKMARGGVLRVCHLGKFYPPASGGIESHLQTLARAQTRLGMAVDVLCVNHRNRQGDDHQPAQTHAQLQRPAGPSRSPQQRWFLDRQLRQALGESS